MKPAEFFSSHIDVNENAFDLGHDVKTPTM